MSDQQDEVALANDGRAKFKVWWIPQVPDKAFEVEVASYAEGRKLEIVLANYDQFQFDNRIKGDYCNAGGTTFCHPALTGGDWDDVDQGFAEDCGWVSPDDSGE